MPTPYEETSFIYSVGVEPYEFNILPNNIFDWKMQGVNCATEDYTLGNTSEISFTFETDLPIELGSMVFVNRFDTGHDSSFTFGQFLFQVIDVTKKKTLLNRYNVTCTSVVDWGLPNKNIDDVIEKSDLSSLPANYTLMDLARFAARSHVWFDEAILVNTTYHPSNTWWYQGLTYRQLYQWCCQLMGVNDASTLWVDALQDYSFTGLFAPTTPEGCCFHFNSNSVKSIDIANYQTPVINKIWFGSESTDVGFSLGSGNQAMMFPSNPLINPTDTSFLNPLYAKVHSLQSYTPMKLELFHKYMSAERKFVINNQAFSESLINSYNSLYDLYNLLWGIPKAGLTAASGPQTADFSVCTPSRSPLKTTSMWAGVSGTTYQYIDYYGVNNYTMPKSRNNMLKNYVLDTDDAVTTVENLRNIISKCEPGSMLCLKTRDMDTFAMISYRTDYVYPTADQYHTCQFLLLEITDDGFTCKRGGANEVVTTYTWEEFATAFPAYVPYPPEAEVEDEYMAVGNMIDLIFFPKASFEPDSPSSSENPPAYVTFVNDTNLYISPYTMTVESNRQSNLYGTITAGTVLPKSEYGGDWSSHIDNEGTGVTPRYYEPYGWHNIVYDGKILYYYDGTQWSSGDVSATTLDPPQYTPPEYDSQFDITQLAWNFIDEQTTLFTNSIENYTWMSYTDDDGNTFYCPIFSWEASPSGIILEGTGNKDRRLENSYLSYDLRTAGKYESINSAISGTEAEISGVTSTVSALNVRVGNVEAAVNNKVDTNDYNGNTIISKINALGVTQTINSNRVDLSSYVQSSSLATVATSGSYSDLTNTPDGDDIITEINAATTTINNSRIGMYIFEDSDSYTTTAADTYEYSGISFEVPADKVFTVEISSSEDTEIPTGIVLSDSDSIISFIKEAVTASMPNATGLSMTFVGHPNSNTTYYIWAKTASTGTVGISYTGWYM